MNKENVQKTLEWLEQNQDLWTRESILEKGRVCCLGAALCVKYGCQPEDLPVTIHMNGSSEYYEAASFLGLGFGEVYNLNDGSKDVNEFLSRAHDAWLS